MAEKYNLNHIEDFVTQSKRKALWEIPYTQHCSIVGTCLSVGEARLIGKKVDIRCPNPEDLDATIHSILVKECATKNRISSLLTKTLNKKFHNSIRLFRTCNRPSELFSLWREAFSVGNIPGPYWAALSHPHLDHDVGVRIYSDVHMLSHLVGSSNQANIVRLTELEIELANAQDKIKKLVSINNDRVKEHKAETSTQREKINALKRKNNNLEGRLFVRDGYQQNDFEKSFSNGILLSGNKAFPNNVAARRNDTKVKNRVLFLTNAVEGLAQEKSELEALVADRDCQIELLAAELKSVELMLNTDQNTEICGAKTCDLAGKCVLYIGGQRGAVCRMCDVVKKMNGNLVYHDGGKEDSLASLPSAVSGADAVLFPTNCVSHSSALEAKRLCKRMSKPYLPVRSSGVGSLIRGLVEIQDQLETKP